MMSDEKTFWEYLEEAGIKVALSCRNWTIWIPEEYREEEE